MRTPMNAILGFNTMLMNRVNEGSTGQKILNHTRQSAEHLMTVINDVLDYSQLQAGKIKIQNETFALHDTVHNAFGLFSPREQSMNLTYHLDMGPDLPKWVKSDKHRLMQILVNLLGNAIKFTHQGSNFPCVTAVLASPRSRSRAFFSALHKRVKKFRPATEAPGWACPSRVGWWS
jgi:signal transduction histidine kinase